MLTTPQFSKKNLRSTHEQGNRPGAARGEHEWEADGRPHFYPLDEWPEARVRPRPAQGGWPSAWNFEGLPAPREVGPG